MTVLAAIASDSVLDAAFTWLCKRRRDYPDHADVWEFRRNWPQEKERIRAELPSGRTWFEAELAFRMVSDDPPDRMR